MVVVNAYIKEIETIQALEQEDCANGVVGFFAEAVLSGDDSKKLFYKASTLVEALKKAGEAVEPGKMVDLYVTLWHVEGGAMREVGVFSHLAADAVWMHEYKEQKQERQLIYTCKLRNRVAQ